MLGLSYWCLLYNHELSLARASGTNLGQKISRGGEVVDNEETVTMVLDEELQTLVSKGRTTTTLPPLIHGYE